MEPILFNKKEAAKFLNIGTRSLERLVRTHRLRVVRIGRRVLFPRLFLEQFVETETIDPPRRSQRTAIGEPVN